VTDIYFLVANSHHLEFRFEVQERRRMVGPLVKMKLDGWIKFLSPKLTISARGEG
jgi:hypothetical protein